MVNSKYGIYPPALVLSIFRIYRTCRESKSERVFDHRDSKLRFNGALALTDDTLVVEGIPPTLTPEVVPDFPTWLIPFIVFFVLIVLTAAAIIGYTVYQGYVLVF